MSPNRILPCCAHPIQFPNLSAAAEGISAQVVIAAVDIMGAETGIGAFRHSAASGNTIETAQRVESLVSTPAAALRTASSRLLPAS